MAVERASAVVIGRFPLGESDRVVTFFTRQFGKVRGVARAARRLRSRFGSALEPFTLGELVFFDNGRSELVQIDHFDIVRPFAGMRDELERLGQASWIAECVARLTADRDPNPAIFTLLVRALTTIDDGARPARTALVFGLRHVDQLGHRLRTDACVACGESGVVADERVAVDVTAGGCVCTRCAAALGGTLTVSASAFGALKRLRRAGWDESMTLPLGREEGELRSLVEAHVSSLIGQSTRSARFLREVHRVSTIGEGPSR
jgi:DNA repair protein RecO (recombination protein O)